MSWIKGLKANFLLRVVSANSLVIAIRLTITLAIQRILAKSFEEYGIAKIGDLRNIMAMLTSFTSMAFSTAWSSLCPKTKMSQVN